MTFQNKGSSEKYDFKKFETEDFVSGSAAPDIHSKTTKNGKIKQLNARDAQYAMQRKIKIMILVAVFVIGFIFQIAALAYRYEINRKVMAVNEKIELENTKNIVLNSELKNSAGIANIDDYAEDVLGMIKAENNRSVYVDFSQGDKVLYSDSVK